MQNETYEFTITIEGEQLHFEATSEQMILSRVTPVRLRNGCFLYREQVFPYNPAKIKDKGLDLDGLPFSDTQEVVNKNRPQTFEDYIGQKNSKTVVKNAIKISQLEDIPMKHTLIYGSRGLGKTTLAYIIAKNLGKEMVEVVGGMLNEKQVLVDTLKKITPEKNILFIDEIHSIPAEVGEILYPILEDGTIEGKKLIPFTVIGATTEIGNMMKNYAPLVDRFSQQLNLLPYSAEELSTIAEKLAERYDVELDKDVALKIGTISRGTARLAVNFTLHLRDMLILGGKDLITLEMVNELMELKQIFENGVTQQDIQVLTALGKVKTLGLNAISQLLRIPERTYLLWTEPFLAEQGFIVRLPRGRSLTDTGRKYLTERK